ncbi:MAG: prepilin-type N-terminal cleavage/methylation domain-containing protein [Planctomycetota bacterium]|nr:MAG: prepilin-type N-terminal cleavage/methylation domain-containing protein [Planctomycetota bacterium]
MRNKGFTLIELVLAMAMLGAVMGLVYPIVVMTVNTMVAFEREAEVLRVGNAVLDLMTRDIQGCYANPNPSQPRLENVFVGSKESELERLDFITTTVSHPDEDGNVSPLTEVGYHTYHNSKNGMFTLFRREDFFVYKGDYTAGGKYHEIYDRFESFKLEYFDGNEWRESWEQEPNPPLAVKIYFVVVPPDITEDQLGFSDEEFLERLREEGGFETIVNIPTGSKSKELLEAEGGTEGR